MHTCYMRKYEKRIKCSRRLREPSNRSGLVAGRICSWMINDVCGLLGSRTPVCVFAFLQFTSLIQPVCFGRERHPRRADAARFHLPRLCSAFLV